MALKGSEQNAEVRVLLVVWSEQKLRKGELSKRVIRSGEKSEDYKPILQKLKLAEAIVEEKKDLFLITEVGVNLLRSKLLDVQFNFQHDDSTPNPKKLGETKKVGQIGAKFGDVLLKWIREESDLKSISSSGHTMDFETFANLFEQAYIDERKTQELRGAIVIYGKKICERFASQNSISDFLLEDYYQRLKSSNKIISIEGRDGEMIEWVN